MRFTRTWGLAVLSALALSPGVSLAQMSSSSLKPRSHSLTQAELSGLLNDRPMTLDDAVRISMIASRPLSSALTAYAKAKGMVSEVNSAFLPQITLGAQASEFDRANTIDLGALMGGPSLPLTIANSWNPSLVAALTMQIDISGAVRSAAKQSEFMALAARIDIDRVRNQLVLDVRTNFYQVLRAHELEQVAADSLAAAELRLHDAQVNERVGNAPKFDVVSAERDVADARQGVVAAFTQESMALSMLKNVIGVDQSAKLVVQFEGGLNPPEATTAAIDEVASEQEFETLVAGALKLRPEVLESDAALEASKHGIHYAKRSMLPSLSAGLGYNYQPNHGAFTPRQSAVATVSLNFPLYDGGLARAKVRQAEADKSEAENNRRGTVDQVKLEVQNSLLNLRQAQTRISMAEAGLTQALEAYRLAQVRYKVGVSQSSVVSPQLELSSAVAALAMAKANRVNAIIDFNQAQASLEHAVGRFAAPSRPVDSK